MKTTNVMIAMMIVVAVSLTAMVDARFILGILKSSDALLR